MVLQSLEFLPAQPSDAKAASRMLFETFIKKATFLLGLGNDQRARKILETIFSIQGHRLSYEYTEIIVYQGQTIGVITSFPGKMLGRLERKLDVLLWKQYRLRGKFLLFLRGYPLLFIKETSDDQYFLSHLAVKRKWRGKGAGSSALAHVEEMARRAGLLQVSLMVNIDNGDARRFYERHGYSINAIHLESNKRVPHLGPGYQRMVKRLER